MPEALGIYEGLAFGITLGHIEKPNGVAEAARERIELYGTEYGKSESPRSPFSKLSGNHTPGVSRLEWLRGRNKCNQFVGDVLYDAGLEMPTYRMHDGSLHYVNADALPRFRSHFDRISDTEGIRPGDLLVIDRLGRRGENGGHVEVITQVDSTRSILYAAGAHEYRASETSLTELLRSLRPKPGTGSFAVEGSPGIEVFVLRPKVRR